MTTIDIYCTKTVSAAVIEDIQGSKDLLAGHASAKSRMDSTISLVSKYSTNIEELRDDGDALSLAFAVTFVVRPP